MRKLIRLAGSAAALLVAAAAQPRDAAAEDLGPKLLYCSVSCLAVSGECQLNNSAEYCSGFAAGCMSSCMLF